MKQEEDNMKYVADVSFIFRGSVNVYAEDLDEAERIVEEDFGMTISSGIHTTNDEAVIDWDFPSHPEREVHQLKEK